MSRSSLTPPSLASRSIAAVSLLGALASSSVIGQTDTFIVSTAKAVEVTSGQFAPFSPGALLRYEPGQSTQPHPFVSAKNFDVIVGDVDSNGEFDDAPVNIDALTWNPTNRRPSVYDLVFSLSAASTTLRGGIVRDGDLVQLLVGGGFKVVMSEDRIATLTGTRTVDIDAAAYLPNGDFVWSFADDEVTTDPALIAQNSNDPKLYDETVFTLPAGSPVVTIRYTKAQMLAMTANAVQAPVTSIVDTVALVADPNSAGDILFATGSSSQALGGKIFTSAGGGSIATINNTPMDGVGAWGLKTRPVIDALTLTTAGKDPLTLALDQYRVVTPAKTSVTLTINGAGPGGTVQLFVSYARMPYPTPWTLPAGLGAIGLGYVTATDPLFLNSTSVPAFSVAIDASGHGAVRFGVGHLPPGVTFVMQGADLSNFEVSEPVALSLVRS